MKFYVAGKFEERDLVSLLCDRLVDRGHEITKDWTVDKETDNGYPVINTVEDVRGIVVADAYVGRFVNINTYKGALVEWGVALGLRKKVFIIGHAMDACIFIHHPLVKQFDNEEQFLEFLNE